MSNTIKDMVGIKGKSGGKRDGAGRPSGLNQKPIAVRLDLDLLDRLSSVGNRNGFINNAVREKLDREEKPEE